jgi:hypothetical protein
VWPNDNTNVKGSKSMESYKGIGVKNEVGKTGIVSILRNLNTNCNEIVVN